MRPSPFDFPQLCVAIILFSLAVPGNGQSLFVDNPSTANFLRRSLSAATVLADYLYIDGGEISQVAGGTQPSPDRPHFPVNSTLSIFLGSSWTTSSVSIRAATPKQTVPISNSQAIWTDPSSNSFFIWGGTNPFPGTIPPPKEVWRYTADSFGGGSWGSTPAANPLVFNQLSRPQGCAATSIDGVGYCLGGRATPSSDAKLNNTAVGFPVLGLTSYGMRSSIWTNSSTTAFAASSASGGIDPGSLTDARAETISVGSNDLLLVLGGVQPNGAVVDFAALNVYDPMGRRWYRQPATGVVPSPRTRFCTAVVQGSSGTVEVLMYGGVRAGVAGALLASDEVYVLSLPGFVWFRAPVRGTDGGNGTIPSTPRADHSCVAARPGGRQILSIGGTDGRSGPEAWLTPDPWSQGIGIFDMSTLRWSDRYAVDTSLYQPADVVANFYAGGGLQTVQWADDNLKAMFTASSVNITTSATNGISSPSSAPPPAMPTLPIPIPALIAACLGGIIVLGLLIGLSIFLFRRRVHYGNRSRSRFTTRPPGSRGRDLKGDDGADAFANTRDKKSKSWQYTVEVRGNATPVPITPTLAKRLAVPISPWTPSSKGRDSSKSPDFMAPPLTPPMRYGRENMKGRRYI